MLANVDRQRYLCRSIASIVEAWTPATPATLAPTSTAEEIAMAKSTFPTVKSGGALPKLAAWAITVLIVVLAIQHPPEAGQVVTTVLTWLHGLIAR
jgi:hypothetical protein